MIQTDFYKAKIREAKLDETYFKDTNLLSVNFYKSDTSKIIYKNCIMPTGEHIQ